MGRVAKLKKKEFTGHKILSISDKKRLLWENLEKGLIPPEKLDLDEWSDKYRYLPRTTSSEHGRWRTSRFPFLKRIMQCLSPTSRAREIVVMKGAQLGFALDLETPILTTKGWATMGTVSKGDYVFGPDGKPTRITITSDVMYNHTCYRVVFSDGSEIVADKDHRWTVDNVKQRTTETINTEKLFKLQKFRKNTRCRYAVRVAEPIQQPKNKLPIDPYTLGLWLGDGNAYSAQLTCHCSDIEGYSKTLKSKGVDHVTRQIDRRSPNTHNIKFEKLHYKLTEAGVLKNKHIPANYLTAHYEDRLELLRGLVDTDGHIRKDGLVEYYGVDRNLIENVAELVASLGYKPHIRNKGPSVSPSTGNIGQDCYVISFMADKQTKVSHLCRKSERQVTIRRTEETSRRYITHVEEVPSRPVRCIGVDNDSHLFLVTNRFIATHNTECCINWILYLADIEPGPVLYVQKTEKSAEDFSSQKLEPNIEACPRVYKLLGEGKPKSLKDTTLTKSFPGGYIAMGGANSASFLRSKSIAAAMADEEDSFKANIDNDGSPVGMLRKRMANFPFSKFFRLSTPQFTETSTIEPAYLNGSQEQYYCPCPECNPRADKAGTYFVWSWDLIKWDKDLDSSGVPKSIYLVCPECGGMIFEHKKTWMLERGVWFSQKGTESPDDKYEVGDVEFPSFQISSLYSPLGFFSWRDALNEWMEYDRSKDKALLQVFINQTLGQTFRAAGQDIASSWLEQRREEYEATVPHGVLCLTAGVDVQDDRLEMEIVGWGLNGENWSIDYQVLLGNPDYFGDAHGLDPNGTPTVWSQLDEYLMAGYQRADGKTMRIECTAIDSGHKGEIVNQYCARREHLRVFPILGRPGWGKGYLKRPTRRHEKYKTWVYLLYVDEIKDQVYSSLRIGNPGPGFCHFPLKDKYNRKHFNQLTAESKEVIMVAGRKELRWTLAKGVRNEALDCRDYNFGAFKIYSPNMEYRAQQAGVGMESPDQQIGAEANQLHRTHSDLVNNPRKTYPAPAKNHIRKRKRGSGGVW